MASHTRRARVSRLIGTSILTLLCEPSITTVIPNWYSDSTSIPDKSAKVNTQFFAILGRHGYSIIAMHDRDSRLLESRRSPLQPQCQTKAEWAGVLTDEHFRPGQRCLAACLLLLAASVVLAHSGGDCDLFWSTVDGGGTFSAHSVRSIKANPPRQLRSVPGNPG